MKKSTMIRLIGGVIKNGGGPAAILQAMEKAGIKPPYSKETDLGCECGCKGRCPVAYGWDNERWTKEES